MKRLKQSSDHKIYIKPWLALKPYTSQAETDRYYLKVCNDLKKVVKAKEHDGYHKFLKDDGIDLLCCFLASYFEDLISGTNIWNTFVRMQKKLYNKRLPFYNTENYVEEEINPQDIQFLIWYFTNTMHDKVFIDPYHEAFEGLSKSIYDVFNDEWEYAPENERLKSHYQLDENEENYYKVRQLIESLLFKSYLFGTDTNVRLREIESEIINEKDSYENLEVMLYGNREEAQHKYHTRLLSLSGKEWVAEILGEDHELYEPIKNTSKRIQGWFFYKGQNEQHLFLEHIASGKKLNVLKESVNDLKSFTEENVMAFMAIVMWKDEWWFSGILLTRDYNADFVKEEKNSIASKTAVNFLDNNEEKIQELLKEQFEVFKEYNHGSQIAFMPADKINKFYENFINYYNSHLKLSEKEKAETKDKLKDEGASENAEEQDFSEIAESGLAFFNPKSGGEIVVGVNSAFPSPSNPFFKEEDCKQHVMYLLGSKGYSTELFMYCVENFKDQLPLFKEGSGKKYLEDIDFFLRFWKKEHYHTKPSLSLV